MLNDAQVELQLTTYQVKLLALEDRYAAGARSIIAAEAQQCADALIGLLEEAPLGKREQIDYLINRYEALQIACLN